jgi:4-amino-4-deoxy-L-arabinose transferase-like glycosyltransferase
MRTQVLVAITGVAVVLRLASALLQGDIVMPLPGIADQITYDTLAQRVLAGYGFSFPIAWWPATPAGQPTAHWSFLYTLYLSGVYGLFGPHPLFARLLQASIAGVLYPLLTFRIGRRLFGEPAGLVTAGLVAVYAYFVYYAGALMTETFFILTVLWAIDLATSLAASGAGASPGRWRAARPWLALGLVLGVGVLLRQVLLVFLPVLFAWLIWYRRSNMRSTLAGLALSALIVAVLIAPWTVRNYQRFDRFVLLNTNEGFAFFWANHPIHGTNFVAILPSSLYHELIPPELLGLDEAGLNAALLQRGIGFVMDDPERYALLSMSRLKDYFEFWPSNDSGLMSNLVRVVSFGVYLPLMLYGAWLTARRVREGPALVLIYLFAVIYSLVHLLSWTLVRYRLPVDAVLMPMAAIAVLDLAARARKLYGARRNRAFSEGVWN